MRLIYGNQWGKELDVQSRADDYIAAAEKILSEQIGSAAWDDDMAGLRVAAVQVHATQAVAAAIDGLAQALGTFAFNWRP
jgi:hypothetical protein